MKPIISKEQCERNLIPITYGISPYVVLIALITIIIYKVIILASSGNIGHFTNPKVLADIFLYTVLFWASFYIFKKLWLNKTFIKPYENIVTGDDKYFLPALKGTSIINSKAGIIYVDDNEVYFNSNSPSPEKDNILILKTEVCFEVEDEQSNFMIRAFWGETKVLIIKNTKTVKRYEFLVPNADEVKEALENVIRTT